MRRVVVVVALVASAFAAHVDTAGATSECRGLMACVPVAGPWVVVPASRKTPRPEVQWQLTCPKGFVVGGVDGELTDQAIDLWFLASSGSPVGPGTTTSRTIVFVATYVGSAGRPVTFRPHAGCIPGSGGGGRRTPTALQAVIPPGRPTVRRVRTLNVKPGRGFAVACHADEHLVSGYASRGLRTQKPPTTDLVASLSMRSALARGRVVVRAHGGAGRGVVQLAAVCAGGR